MILIVNTLRNKIIKRLLKDTLKKKNKNEIIERYTEKEKWKWFNKKSLKYFWNEKLKI